VVDAAVGGERGGVAAQPEAAQRGTQRQALGAVEVEDGVVEVEEDGAQPGQGYFAR
jgi:hypothetical protein